jgi:hypothetical protein
MDPEANGGPPTRATSRTVNAVGIVKHVTVETAGTYGTEAGVDTVPVVVAGHSCVPDWHALDGIIGLGGPMSATDDDCDSWLRSERAWIRAAVKAGPLFHGVCLGAHLLALALGGSVYAGPGAGCRYRPRRPDAASRAGSVVRQACRFPVGLPLARRHLLPAPRGGPARWLRQLCAPGIRYFAGVPPPGASSAPSKSERMPPARGRSGHPSRRRCNKPTVPRSWARSSRPCAARKRPGPVPRQRWVDVVRARATGEPPAPAPGRRGMRSADQDEACQPPARPSRRPGCRRWSRRTRPTVRAGTPVRAAPTRYPPQSRHRRRHHHDLPLFPGMPPIARHARVGVNRENPQAVEVPSGEGRWACKLGQALCHA